MQPSAPPSPKPLKSLDSEAAIVGIGLVLVALLVAAQQLASGSTVPGLVLLGAALLWLGVPAVPAARTFRWSAETVINRPAEDVLEVFADPEQALRFERVGDYNPEKPDHGSLGIEVLERSGATVRYVQFVGTGRDRPLTAEVVRTVDWQRGVVTSNAHNNRGAGDLIRVADVPDGTLVTYSTEIRFPYLTALAGVWLAHGRFERGAAARQAGVLARVKAAMESDSAA